MDSTVGLMEKLRAEPVAHERSVELRPGVFRPDWTMVSTLPAREALRGRGEFRQSALVIDNRWFSSPYNDQYDTA
jgi:hypothetical protein